MYTFYNVGYILLLEAVKTYNRILYMMKFDTGAFAQTYVRTHTF